MKTLLLIVSLAASVSTVRAQAVKRLYLANDDHTDYMWTASEARYDSAFVQMLDYYLRQIDSTRHNPDDFQARWNCDGSYWLRTYQTYRSPAQFDRLMNAIRSGHISSPLNSVVSTYGGQPTEAMLRGMYYAGKLERQYSLRFPMAIAMENQTLPMGLSSLWAGSGAKYSWRGVCGCASRLAKTSLAHRPHQLYRYMGPDGRSVIMKWYSLLGENTGLGGYSETRPLRKTAGIAANFAHTIDDLTALCDTVSAQSAYPYNVAGAFGYGWDDLSTFQAPAFIAAAQTGTTPTRRVRVSNEEDFFRDVERSYPSLPSESVSYGNEWDLYPVSMNETTAQVRRATEKLRSAEALAALVSLNDTTFAADLTPARQQAWDAYGLYWEHNWTADGPVTRQERANWQLRQQGTISRYVDTLYSRSVRALGRQIRAADATARRFYVFNPLSWSRSDAADFLLPSARPVRVIDLAENKEVASQVVHKGGRAYLRIWAENVPSVGYKVFEIQNAPPRPQPMAAKVTRDIIENAYYRLRLRPSGVISDLVDRRAGNRAVVQPVGGRLVNDLGTVNPDAGQKVEVENAGAVSVTLKAVSSDPVPHTVRVTLYKSSHQGKPTGPARIDLEDSIQANFGDIKTWAFSFNLTRPTTRHEELGAVLTAREERRGGHYANRSRTGGAAGTGPARYDWLTFNHFADLSDAAYGVTLSNLDCSFFRLGGSTVDSLWEQSPQLNALAGGQVDGPELGIRQQNGATAFRYQFALTTHPAAFDAQAAMRFALEHQNPLVTGAVTGLVGNYPPMTYSLLTVSDRNVLLWGLKASEEGISNGLIARFWNVTHTATAPTLRLAMPISRAWQTTHIETNERPLPPRKGRLTLPFAPSQLNTYRLQVQR